MKTIKIKDYYGIYQEIPVTDELYEEWRQMQNETQRIRKKEIYHRNWTTLEDIDSYLDHPDRELEDELILREEIRALYEAIDKLTPTQQRRIRMYMENTSMQYRLSMMRDSIMRRNSRLGEKQQTGFRCQMLNLFVKRYIPSAAAKTLKP